VTNDLIVQAAHLIASADALQITARAGMGVDSGVDISTSRHTRPARGCPIIRINTSHSQLPKNAEISLQMRAKEALRAIAEELCRLDGRSVPMGMVA